MGVEDSDWGVVFWVTWEAALAKRPESLIYVP